MNQRINPLFCTSHPGMTPVDMYKALRQKDIITAGTQLDIVSSASSLNVMGHALDLADWLPYAAKSYNISANVSDYILQPYVVIVSDIPNRNAVGFSTRELVRWNRDIGRCAYAGWKGQPMFLEHDNADHTKALGVVADVTMRKLEGYGDGSLWKVVVLAALDRTRAPVVASKVLSGEINMVSMGCYVEYYSCSKCGSKLGHCSHLNPKAKFDFYIDSAGDLVYRMCNVITPFETSFVETGAYAMALNGNAPMTV